MFLETLILLFIYFSIFFVIGQVIKDNSIVDIGWGLGFAVIALYTFFRNPDSGLKGILITIGICIWGLRLAFHIAKRNWGKPEDYRYVDMRKGWGTKFVLFKAFLQVYFLQMMIQYTVSIPVIYGNTTTQQMFWFNWIGVVMWATGFFFESCGDFQLKQFISNSVNKGKLMDKGLWALTRHPNYFGDSCMWFGIFFIAITNIEGIWIIVGPTLMTFFLVFVSGVRLLEKKYTGRSDYEDYKKRTSAFIPWFPKKIKQGGK